MDTQTVSIPPTRRNLLTHAVGATAAIAIVGRGIHRDHPDADLIRRCGDLDRLAAEGHRLAALPENTPGRWEALNAQDDAWQPGMAEAAKIPALTLEGVRARTLALNEYLVPDLREACRFWGDPPVAAMLGAFLADLAVGAVA